MNYSILLIEDDPVFSQLLTGHLNKIGYTVDYVTSWSEANDFLNQSEPDMVILDKKLPDADATEILPKLVGYCPVIILTAFGSVQSAVEAIKLGAADYLSKPVNLDELELVIKRVLDNVRIRRDLKFARASQYGTGDKLMVGTSAAIEKVHSYVEAVAQQDMTVLVLGESGAGKEVVAKSIHLNSQRKDHNFVAVDCCAFSEELFESELFGHEKGAFTSADKRKSGLIEGARDGTLFLDEIGEIQPSIQAKLLHVLETGMFRRVGGTKDLNANVRIIAATNRDLGELCAAGKFRSDLFYRLNGFVINVPGLSERSEDIPLLVQHFLKNHNMSGRAAISVDDSAMETLVNYDWPGNVRELKNVVERALILMGNSTVMTSEHITYINHRGPTQAEKEEAPLVRLDFKHEPTLEEIENQYVGMILDRHNQHRTKTANILGISERTLYRLLNRR